MNRLGTLSSVLNQTPISSASGGRRIGSTLPETLIKLIRSGRAISEKSDLNVATWLNDSG